MACERIVLGGVVQGVGFRPFVYRLAQQLGVAGWVRNSAGVVEICAAATPEVLDDFRTALLAEAPAAARPELRAVSPGEFTGTGFTILDSTAGETVQGLPPDLAPCPDCLAEMAAPGRRHRYPFINCTQCGPRYSIIRALPYDRANTTMAEFPLCPACAAEYENPADRRFHAEPVACPDCGPRLRFGALEGEAALAACLTVLRAGQIVAVKGVGGYHLFCDAADEAALARLRARKHRPEKPLALLLPETRVLDYVVADNPALHLPSRPILLLEKRPGLLDALAPGLTELGVMLPDSPLHHLLAEGFGAALVATSANRSGEPMVTDEAQAEAELAGIADGFLHHDRRIERAVDDSVLRIIDGAPRLLRAGRGVSPIEMKLPFTLDRPVLALGGHMKSTIALAWGDKAVISPHLGELDNAPAQAAFARMAADLQALYGVRAEVLIADAHEGYASTRWARAQGLPVETVWHHHAHASAVAGEYGGAEMLAFTWDGVGLGPDGALWGGEALLGRPGSWRVAARLRRLRLQGGDAVSRAPWRAAAAMCWHTGIAPPEGLMPEALAHTAWTRGLNCHESSAVGRLFDGAAALLGLCHTASYEGQGPALLEALAGPFPDAVHLPMHEVGGIWEADWASLVPMLLDDTLPKSERAARFHAALAATGVEITRLVGAKTVGLAGGVFQNRKLAESLLARLRAAGITAHLGRRIPANDAGLSFGQVIEFGARQWMK
ncbi:MAG: carbamoyltransferase HypF [Acidocella sp.]|nr:carbamoyltransferase HypF [Acidocella sp.]